MDATQLEQLLDKLIRDVEASVHAFYRGEVRQHTQRIKTDTFRAAARDALLPMLNGTSAAPDAPNAPGAPAGAAALAPDDVPAATRCVMAWMPMGPPASASPQSRCVPAAREMAP